MKSLSIKITGDEIKKSLQSVLKYKRLFFILIFGALIIYTFDGIYKNTYLNINFNSEYLQESEVVKKIRLEEAILTRIIDDTKDREERARGTAYKKYDDPFSFENMRYPAKETFESVPETKPAEEAGAKIVNMPEEPANNPDEAAESEAVPVQ